MKAFWLTALQTIVKAIVGQVDYNIVRELVSAVENTTLSGTQKKAMVVEKAKIIGVSIGTALLNLAIETAVASLRK